MACTSLQCGCHCCYSCIATQAERPKANSWHANTWRQLHMCQPHVVPCGSLGACLRLHLPAEAVQCTTCMTQPWQRQNQPANRYRVLLRSAACLTRLPCSGRLAEGLLTEVSSFLLTLLLYAHHALLKAGALMLCLLLLPCWVLVQAAQALPQAWRVPLRNLLRALRACRLQA